MVLGITASPVAVTKGPEPRRCRLTPTWSDSSRRPGRRDVMSLAPPGRLASGNGPGIGYDRRTAEKVAVRARVRPEADDRDRSGAGEGLA
jgi:hypothetical protein